MALMGFRKPSLNSCFNKNLDQQEPSYSEKKKKKKNHAANVLSADNNC